MEKVIGILEEESEYPKRLARYINDRHDIGCVAVAFQTPEEVLRFGEKNPFYALLIGEHAGETEESFSELLHPGGRLFQLSEEPVKTGQLLPSGIRLVFRYQRAEELVRQVLNGSEEPALFQGGLYTVYCPGSNISSERFAWQLARRLSEHGKTLFLSWEPFGGFGRNGEEEERMTGNISELLYLLRGENHSKKERLCALPVKEGVAYVPGVDYCTDLWQYSAEELLAFLKLCREEGYQNIVFLAGFFSESIEALMEQSEEVCLVKDEGPAAEWRHKEFFRQMKYAGKQELLSRVKEVEVQDKDEFSDRRREVSSVPWRK
ncbi:MAG: hypothetical protein ACI4FZ_00495 [Lachnospiraceae bacterium]